jgi:hypothetical protein
MIGENGLGVGALTSDSAVAIMIIVALLLIAWFAPNSQEFVDYQGPDKNTRSVTTSKPTRWAWKPTMSWAFAIGCLTALSIMSLSKVSEFLYFQF